MTPIYLSTTDVLSIGGWLGGYLYVEDLVGSGSYQFDSGILTDIEETLGAISLDRFAVGWSQIYFEVTDYDPTAVSTFSGFPEKHKFGQIAFGGINWMSAFEFLYYPVQLFALQTCQLNPLPSALPDDASVLPPGIADIAFLTSISSQIRNSGGVDFSAKVPTSVLYYDLNASVEGRIIIFYGITISNPPFSALSPQFLINI